MCDIPKWERLNLPHERRAKCDQKSRPFDKSRLYFITKVNLKKFVAQGANVKSIYRAFGALGPQTGEESNHSANSYTSCLKNISETDSKRGMLFSSLPQGKEKFLSDFRDSKDNRQLKRMARGSKSKILRHIIYCLDIGKHEHMLYWIDRLMGEFCIKLVHKTNPSWHPNQISLFEDLDKLSPKKFQKYKNCTKYLSDCRIRFNSNLNKLVKDKAILILTKYKETKSITIIECKIINFSAGEQAVMLPELASELSQTEQYMVCNMLSSEILNSVSSERCVGSGPINADMGDCLSQEGEPVCNMLSSEILNSVLSETCEGSGPINADMGDCLSQEGEPVCNMLSRAIPNSVASVCLGSGPINADMGFSSPPDSGLMRIMENATLSMMPDGTIILNGNLVSHDEFYNPAGLELLDEPLINQQKPVKTVSITSKFFAPLQNWQPYGATQQMESDSLATNTSTLTINNAIVQDMDVSMYSPGISGEEFLMEPFAINNENDTAINTENVIENNLDSLGFMEEKINFDEFMDEDSSLPSPNFKSDEDPFLSSTLEMWYNKKELYPA